MYFGLLSERHQSKLFLFLSLSLASELSRIIAMLDYQVPPKKSSTSDEFFQKCVNQSMLMLILMRLVLFCFFDVNRFKKIFFVLFCFQLDYINLVN